ncbi:MAG: peptidase, partial [Thermoleophilia bacterium]|nr:peptidase [Thermoleophilia bacterium]
VPVYEISGPLRVGEVTKQSPAEEAGITAKSEITGWNGPVEGLTTGELNDRVDDGRGKSTEVAWVDANGATHTETLVPRSLDDEGPPLIGVAFAGADQERVGSEDHTLGFGARTALEDMRAISWGNLTGLSKLFFESEAREEVGSVVGIVHVADVVEENDRLLWYAGVISLVLAVMNLLPLLPLDGGHLLFGCFEAIRRRPVPRAVFERYSMVGIGLVLVLFMIGLTNDIGRIRG